MPITGKTKTKIDLTIGGMATVTDSVRFSGSASSWLVACYTMVEALHLQEAILTWKGAFFGDYGWMALMNPAGDGSPDVALSAGNTVVDFGTGAEAVAGQYDPAAYETTPYMEFWDAAETTLVEMRPINSVSGTTVTLGEAVTNAHATTAKLKLVVQMYSPPRGDGNLEQGLSLLGDGSIDINSENAVTELIPVGMTLCARVKTAADAGTREIAINFKFRRPEA